MEIKEFGERDEAIILLILGFCTPLSMWESQIKVFRKEYHVLVPVLDGYDNPLAAFLFVENRANQIIDYLKENNYKEIFALCRFFLGDAVGLYLLSGDRLIVKKAIIDAGITSSHASKIKESLIVHKDLF